MKVSFQQLASEAERTPVEWILRREALLQQNRTRHCTVQARGTESNPTDEELDEDDPQPIMFSQPTVGISGDPSGDSACITSCGACVDNHACQGEPHTSHHLRVILTHSMKRHLWRLARGTTPVHSICGTTYQTAQTSLKNWPQTQLTQRKVRHEANHELNCSSALETVLTCPAMLSPSRERDSFETRELAHGPPCRRTLRLKSESWTQ